MNKTSKYMLITFPILVGINFLNIFPSSFLFVFWLLSAGIADIYYSAKESEKQTPESNEIQK